jgi:hypothetical protein
VEILLKGEDGTLKTKPFAPLVNSGQAPLVNSGQAPSVNSDEVISEEDKD